MRKISVDIGGLGRVVSKFLDALLSVGSDNVKVITVAEPREDIQSVKFVKEKGIAYFKDARNMLESLENSIDALFELTGNAVVRSDLHEILVKTGNKKTVIVPEPVAYLIWSLITEDAKEYPG